MQEKQGIRDIYRFYKRNTDKSVDLHTFRRIWGTFAEQVIQIIILEGKDFNMPSLGSIGIRKQKIIVSMTKDGDIDKRYLAPDWKATKELWKKDSKAKENKQLVFHLNKHFNGFVCKWFWDRRTCSVPNYGAYALQMTRANKRLLASTIQDEDVQVDYYEQKPRRYKNILL